MAVVPWWLTSYSSSVYQPYSGRKSSQVSKYEEGDSRYEVNLMTFMNESALTIEPEGQGLGFPDQVNRGVVGFWGLKGSEVG